MVNQPHFLPSFPPACFHKLLGGRWRGRVLSQALYLYAMDIHERLAINITDFFDEASVPLRLPAPPSEVGESLCPHQAFPFSFEDSLGINESIAVLPPLQDPPSNECISLRDNHDIDDTNPLQDFLPQPQEATSNLIATLLSEHPPHQLSEDDQHIPEAELEQIINYLVAYSNSSKIELSLALHRRFPRSAATALVETLIDKFSKLKKTKEELVKYCMRKAFKFILQLPKNRHMLCDSEVSFSKSKSRYLKSMSQEKSMNSKFLQQIFSQGDFAEDYLLFLKHFEDIMREDNQRKVKYLANLLSKGSSRGVELVKRLPWTSFIMAKVGRISQELLKFRRG